MGAVEAAGIRLPNTGRKLIPSDGIPAAFRYPGKESVTDNLTDQDRKDYFSPGSGGNGETPEESAPFSYGALFDAPDFSSLIRGRRRTGAREYEVKVKSALKSAAIGCMRAGDLPDAAAIFHYGPGFASATGDLCAVNDRAKNLVDILTAPDNPYVTFAFAAVPFAAQVFRNHERQLEAIPQARKQARERRKLRRQQEDTRKVATLHIPLLRREIKVRIGLRVNPFRGLRQGFTASSRPPAELVTFVFSDPELREALAKQGIEIVQSSGV
jgi:hypothetical protein